MTATSTTKGPRARSEKLTQENAVLLLENLVLKERMDSNLWDLRQMRKNVELMKKIVESAPWSGAQAEFLSSRLVQTLVELVQIIQERDATRVSAGHTHVEQALSDLRDHTFGLSSDEGA